MNENIGELLKDRKILKVKIDHDCFTAALDNDTELIIYVNDGDLVVEVAS